MLAVAPLTAQCDVRRTIIGSENHFVRQVHSQPPDGFQRQSFQGASVEEGAVAMQRTSTNERVKSSSPSTVMDCSFLPAHHMQARWTGCEEVVWCNASTLSVWAPYSEGPKRCMMTSPSSSLSNAAREDEHGLEGMLLPRCGIAHRTRA